MITSLKLYIKVRHCSVVWFDVAGVVNESIDRRHTSVKFDAGELGCQTVAARYVLPRGGAVPRPQLAVHNTLAFSSALYVSKITF